MVRHLDVHTFIYFKLFRSLIVTVQLAAILKFSNKTANYLKWKGVLHFRYSMGYCME